MPERELQLLHDRGVRVAIDDFGTGFSVTRPAAALPGRPDEGRPLVHHGVEHEPKDAAITTGLINLAHALGLKAIAEGVECEEQLEVVRELGCDLAQGYLLARPMRPEDVSALFVQGAAVVPATSR